MASQIERFFEAWGASGDQQTAMVTDAVSEAVTYTDPRGTIQGAQALCDYVAQFAASAPGAAAEVVETARDGETHKVRVRFFGEGWEQFGRYDVQLDDDARLRDVTGIAEKTT